MNKIFVDVNNNNPLNYKKYDHEDDIILNITL